MTASLLFTPTPKYKHPPIAGLEATLISAGDSHTCAITKDGSVRCWGKNEDGQLGDGTRMDKSIPVDVLGLEDDVIDIAAGYNHTCAVLAGGKVKCWGNNAFGELGDGTQTGRAVPVEVLLPEPVKMIATGTYRTCAAGGRALYCWGIVGNKLVDGEEVITVSSEPTPVAVSAIPPDEWINDLESGSDFSCLLTDEGGVYCWGRNDQGQLGLRYTANSSDLPERVYLKHLFSENWPDGPIENDVAVQISTGGSHACAEVKSLRGRLLKCWGYNKADQLGLKLPRESAVPVEPSGVIGVIRDFSGGAFHTCASISNGHVICWGDNRFGQVGGEKTEPGQIFVDVAGLPPDAETVSAGGAHTCAVLRGGGVACWGDNRYGQLGLGSTGPVATLIMPQPTPKALQPAAYTQTPTWTKGKVPTSLAYTPTPGISNSVISITAGRDHSCAVVKPGGVACWGKNEHGQLGDGSQNDSPIPVTVSGLTGGIEEVVAGWGHSCALNKSGGVKCWGYNKNGELGNGNTSDSNAPVQVWGLESGVASLEAGDDHTCAVMQSGVVKCWGYNLYGQLGDGTAVDSGIPVEVAGLKGRTVAVAAGWGHTCALSESGGVWCWGNNDQGQAGNGSEKENFHEPVGVAGLNNSVTEISADGGHTCALTVKGLVMCWGNNRYGQLGDGTAEARNVPVVVAGMKFLPVSIAAGWNHSCAVDEAGAMVCWGWDYYGQLGDGIRTTSTRPVESSELMHRVNRMALGWGHMCVITGTGGIQCWGLNASGQLGDGTTEDAYLPGDVLSLMG